MQKRLTNDTSIVEYTSDLDDRFSVWVSFAEIYNEAIYDLLQPVIPNSKRKQLKLGQDNNKNYYIKGLKHIFVRSEEEAYKVLMFGKTNLQVAATGMNSRSSRSHCVFTIKLIKSPNVEHPERVVVSSFSICDLAGAERQKKTLNVGLRLKESQNINCSLHVLGRCFTIIRENQVSTERKMIPFRDSKLTQLFKHALTGKESVTMIVNVNSDHQLCEETQHVLKASAVAKHIVVQPRKVKMPKRETRQSMFSLIVKHNRSTLIPWDSCVKHNALGQNKDEAPEVEEPNVNEREQKQEQYENLLSLVEELQEKLKEEKAKHNETKRNWKIKEEEVRKEAKEELTQFLEKVKQKEESDRKKTGEEKQVFDKTKKRRLLSPEEFPPVEKQKTALSKELGLDQSIEFKDLQEEVKMQKKQIDGLTDLVNILKDEKKDLGMELTLARLNLGHRERDITNLKAKIEMFGEVSTLHKNYLALEKQMEEKLLIRDALLNEAKEDLLEELRAKDDLEEEITKLEKELTEKEEEMFNNIEEFKQEIVEKDEEIALLEARIENMEYEHEEELTSLKSKITVLEEKIACMSSLEEKSLSCTSNLEKQIETLAAQKEEVLCEKLSVEEKFNRQIEEYNTFKQETADKFKTLAKTHEEELTKTVKDFEQKLKSRNEEIRQLKEESEVQLQYLESIKEELHRRTIEAESHKLNLEKKEQDYDSLKTKLENEITKLTQMLDEGDKLSVISDELRSKCHSLQEALVEKSNEIGLLQKAVESLTYDKKNLEKEYSTEISTLEQSCKNQLKETQRLWDLQTAQGLENERQAKELSKAKNILADLNKSLKIKEHELECCLSKMMGYEKMVPTLQSQFELQRKELLEYKTTCENQKETIINMEKELVSFQVNQKEIIGKYEDNLKKTKDENESLKKEVARVTTTFYKSTPTPKKFLEEQLDKQRIQIEDLRKQLEQTEAHSEKLLKENGMLCSQLDKHMATDELNKENESTFFAREGKRKPKTNRLAVDFDVRRRALSCEDDYSSSDLENKKAKSASKARARRTTRATTAVVPATTETEAGTSKVSEDKPKKQTRKKLWDATFNDDVQFEDDDRQLNLPQDSPGTYYRRTLRNRKK